MTKQQLHHNATVAYPVGGLTLNDRAILLEALAALAAEQAELPDAACYPPQALADLTRRLEGYA